MESHEPPPITLERGYLTVQWLFIADVHVLVTRPPSGWYLYKLAQVLRKNITAIRH